MDTAGAGTVDLVAVSALALSATADLYSGRAWLFGFTLANSSATDAARVIFLDGGTGTAAVVAVVTVPAGFSAVQHPSGPGWPLRAGLRLQVTAGTLDAVAIIGREVTP